MRNVLVIVVIMLSISAVRAQSFSKEVRPFLAKYCAECHNAQVHKGGLDLSTYKSIMTGGDNGPIIEPGKAAKSLFVTLVEGKEKPIMPPKNAKFQPKKNEIAVLRGWVDAGAKEDAGALKVAVPLIKPRKWTPEPVVEVIPSGKDWWVATSHAFTPFAQRNDNRPDTDGKILTAIASTRDDYVAAIGRPGEEGSLRLVKGNEWKTGHRDSILALAVSRDGKTLASGGYDSLIQLWSLPDGKRLRSLKEHSDSVYSLAFSPDGKRLASASADRAVKVWNVADGKLLYTLGEATDWVYSLAWSPDGDYLAAGSADKSIRVYRPSENGAKLLHSAFAHDGTVHKLVFDHYGRILYSLGTDRVVKAWDVVRMVEKRVFDAQPETVLALGVSADGKEIALGRFDGVVQILSTQTGKLLRESRPIPPKVSKTSSEAETPAREEASTTPVLFQETAAKFSILNEEEPNNSPATGQPVKTPATIAGVLEKTGETDYFRIEGPAGFELGLHVQGGQAGKLEPNLQVLDLHGKLLAESGRGHLGFRFPAKGAFVVGLRDREFRGGSDFKYSLHMGPIPVVNAVFPLGVKRGTDAVIHIDGVHLGESTIKLSVPESATVGSKLPLPLKQKKGPLGSVDVVVGEFAETATRSPEPQAVPFTANGQFEKEGAHDVWTFSAKKGQPLVVEVQARRLGSNLDSILEVLDAKDVPVERAVLRCQAKTFVTFRDHDSAVPGIRIDAWDDLSANDWILIGTELMKIRALPAHPDADCNFFSEGGSRLAFLDTTPTHHSQGVPAYKVNIHPPGSVFPPNGFPVFKLQYRNDDGGPRYGRDSRIAFDPPADGTYKVKIADARGQGGVNYGYRLTVRPPQPSFSVKFSPTAPAVGKGSGVPLAITAERIDDFNGEISLRFENVPAGFHVPATNILPGDTTTSVTLFAEADALKPEKGPGLKLVATATIGGTQVVKEAIGQMPTISDPGEILTQTVENSLKIAPGGETKLTVKIERQNGFKGRVPLEVRGLPHGVRVLDIGLNGILITERESARTMVLYAEPWVAPTQHPIVVLARHEGKKTEHAARSVLLNIGK